MARFELPSGRPLDLLEMDINATGAFCWFPEPPARLLIIENSSNLYRFDFEPYGDSTALRPIRWKTTPPDSGHFDLFDVIMSSAPCLRDYAIVSLMPQIPVTGATTSSHLPLRSRELWWLRLDEDGTAIEATGRVTSDRTWGPGSPDSQQHYPLITTLSDGRLYLVFLFRPDLLNRWSLRIVALVPDPVTGAPSTRPDRALTLADGLYPAKPFVSNDRRWLYASFRPNDTKVEVRRFPVDEILAALDAEPMCEPCRLITSSPLNSLGDNDCLRPDP